METKEPFLKYKLECLAKVSTLSPRTLAAYGNRLDHLCRASRHHHPIDLTLAEIDGVIFALSMESPSVAYQTREAVAWFFGKGIFAEMPAQFQAEWREKWTGIRRKYPQPDKPKRRGLSPEQAAEWLANLKNPVFRLALQVTAATDLELETVLSLRPEDVRCRQDRILGCEIDAPELFDALAEQKAMVRGLPFLFPAAFGNYRRPVSEGTVEQAVLRARPPELKGYGLKALIDALRRSRTEKT